MTAIATVLAGACAAALLGCKKQSPPATGETRAKTSEHQASEAGHGGPVIDLGTATIGAFMARATRDQGQIVAQGRADRRHGDAGGGRGEGHRGAVLDRDAGCEGLGEGEGGD